jgi:uncharacterized surface protein with fasciclin (FAS1) repeats
MFHVVPGKTMAANVKTAMPKRSKAPTWPLSKAGTFVTVEDGLVQTADVVATNGVVHVIDAVLMPPAAR